MSYVTKMFVFLLLGEAFLIGWIVSGRSFGAEASLIRTHSEGGVTIEMTYLNPGVVDDARFQMILNTHSVNLDSFDARTSSVLRDETGKEYQPSKVENKGSGHHRELVVIFPKPGGKKLELVVKDVAGVKERSFRWDLQ